MTVKPFRWFIAVILTLSLAVTAVYLRYHYMDPHHRYDLWQDEYQTMVPGGEWIPEKLAEKEA